MSNKKINLTFKGSANKGDMEVDLPPSSNYCQISNECRELVSNYFDEHYNDFGDKHIESYLRKTIDIKILHNFSLFFNIDAKNIDLDTLATNDDFIDRVIKDKKPIRRNIFSYALFGLFYLVLYAINPLIQCFIAFKAVKSADILYLRKKDYPDLGLRDILLSKLKLSTFDSCLIGFSYSKSKYGFTKISDYKRSFSRCLKSLYRVSAELISLSRIASFNDIPYRLFFRLLSDSFLMANIVNLKPIIFTGVLLDKPYYILIDKYKDMEQRIHTINESFFYPPFRTFDYTYADTYYSMNKIDEEMQNHFGGHISSFKRVSFFRKDLLANSKGLSKDLLDTKKKFSKTILATTVQISDQSFIQFGIHELNSFLNALIEYAGKHPEYLIILKGKKNELSLVENDLMVKIVDMQNIYLINSIKPRLLKYNHFEDIINISDLMISMNHASTTIWQAFSYEKPVIAINDCHPKSFLADYTNVEVQSERLTEAINYWLNNDAESTLDAIHDISKYVNLGDFDGLTQIADDLDHHKIYAEK